jgi:U2 small nuclear ribonucleoprotein A'
VPNVETLILTNNRVAELRDVDPLAALPKLTMLSLAGNPVALKSQYRCGGLPVRCV